MKRRWFQSIVVLGAIAVLSLSAYAAETPKTRFSAKVKVTVGGNESIKSTVSSYLNRELRSLNDVELVDDNHDWEISVVAMEPKNLGGEKIGFALSVVMRQMFNNKGLQFFFKPENEDIGVQITSGLSYYPQHYLSLGMDLQAMCKEIIVKFDTECLEKSRKDYRLFIELRNRTAKEKP